MSWLSIVGIGEDGLAGLGDAGMAAISGAEIVFGGARHLELAPPAITGEARAWLSPFSASIDAIIALRGRKICVLASGDPFHHGVGATLARQITAPVQWHAGVDYLLAQGVTEFKELGPGNVLSKLVSTIQAAAVPAPAAELPAVV